MCRCSSDNPAPVRSTGTSARSSPPAKNRSSRPARTRSRCGAPGGSVTSAPGSATYTTVPSTLSTSTSPCGVSCRHHRVAGTGSRTAVPRPCSDQAERPDLVALALELLGGDPQLLACEVVVGQTLHHRPTTAAVRDDREPVLES